MRSRTAQACLSLLLFMFLFLTGLAVVSTAANAQDGVLTIEIDGLKSDQGTVMIALFNSAESFMDVDKAFRREARPISGMACQWVIQDLPAGRYGVSIFHDENGNSKLDTGLFGAPKEPYGFSNNARARFGPPDWDAVVFDFKPPAQTMVIKVE